MSSHHDPRLPPIIGATPPAAADGHCSPATANGWTTTGESHHSSPASSRRPPSSSRSRQTDTTSGCWSLCACVRLPRLLSAYSRRRRRRSSVHPAPQRTDTRPAAVTALNGFVAHQLTAPVPLNAAGAVTGHGSDDASGHDRGYRVVQGPVAEGRLRLPWLPPEEQLSNVFDDQHRTGQHRMANWLLSGHY